MDFQQRPIGFAMALAQNSAAMEAYAALSREAQSDILTRAHGAVRRRKCTGSYPES